MTPAATTLTVFLTALVLFIADFLPMGLVVFMVPMALLPIIYPFYPAQ